jgi:3-methyladenine DNA glycosylase/8-oxoguanine DNA glycosylase
MRPYAAGSLFEGIVSCLAGQSISVAAAAVTEARICALFHPGIELLGRRFWPMPAPEQFAVAAPALVRESGVTWRRAEAIVAAAQAWVAGALTDPGPGDRSPDVLRDELLALPLVGPWTAESALLWGIGLDDAFPPNDAALLRAARGAYGDLDLTHRGLTARSDNWRPARGWAARWLWIGLFGPAPGEISRDQRSE